MSDHISGREKDRLYQRRKDLESKISSGMPTHGEMWKPTKENCLKHLAWEKANKQNIQEFKDVSHKLDPSNPNIGRVEHLRKQGEADKLARWA